MRCRIEPPNPFSTNRYGYAFARLADSRRVLDYGAHDGWFIAKVAKARPNVSVVGVDRDAKAIKESHHDVRLVAITSSDLPFDAHSFDAVTLLDVIEHVHDQDSVLKEIYRVLTPAGRLIVTVPRQHVFSVLDLGNLKFRFPLLHRWLFVLRHGRTAYVARYQDNPFGLVGDVEVLKGWHEHFTPRSMRSLLERNGFHIEDIDGSGLFARVFLTLDYLSLGWLCPRRLRRWDQRRFASMNLFVEAVKRPASTPGRPSMTD